MDDSPIVPVLGLLSPFFVFLLGESTSKIKGIYREECDGDFGDGLSSGLPQFEIISYGRIHVTSQDCVANAVRNPNIGLTCLLEILVCLLNMLQPAAPGLLANMSQCKLILVNLSDMSEFITCVRNPG